MKGGQVWNLRQELGGRNWSKTMEEHYLLACTSWLAQFFLWVCVCVCVFYATHDNCPKGRNILSGVGSSLSISHKERAPTVTYRQSDENIFSIEVLFFLFFYWIFSLFTFQMLSPFPVSIPPRNTLSHPPSPCFYEGVPPPTHPLLPPHPWFPYSGASIEPS